MYLAARCHLCGSISHTSRASDRDSVASVERAPTTTRTHGASLGAARPGGRLLPLSHRGLIGWLQSRMVQQAHVVGPAPRTLRQRQNVAGVDLDVGTRDTHAAARASSTENRNKLPTSGLALSQLNNIASNATARSTLLQRRSSTGITIFIIWDTAVSIVKDNYRTPTFSGASSTGLVGYGRGHLVRLSSYFGPPPVRRIPVPSGFQFPMETLEYWQTIRPTCSFFTPRVTQQTPKIYLQ
ncbi:hypothetical protein B0T26DRAFT_764714 [Lasiosphaeria miniovina]|uniref:Uncharacterized protein n=1 Tax=Lasiosphaeria miniovina TaxID=1954250 RepID=A0AA40B3V7_9PEZI|nr:uncharacterized protein B0T26DRAFT_764714 [Lasiosphaeria miniovina]KAK0727134.1 hypothetical protein B0T26DRAFT_764714 [Lasiosphaeria miniovina]